MSYNIISVEEIELDATINTKDLLYLCKKYEEELAECNFLEDHCDQARQAENIGNSTIKFESFEWSGSWSGKSLDKLKDIAPFISGIIKVILTYEDGALQGIMIKNGKFFYRNVEIDFVDE